MTRLTQLSALTALLVALLLVLPAANAKVGGFVGNAYAPPIVQTSYGCLHTNYLDKNMLLAPGVDALLPVGIEGLRPVESAARSADTETLLTLADTVGAPLDDHFRALALCADDQLPILADNVQAAIAQLTPPPPPPPVARPPEMVTQLLTLPATGFFAFDSARLSEEGKAALDRLATALLRHGRVDSVEIVGHTDSIGAATYNQGLSERRAAAAAAYLAERGVDPNLLQTRGLGESAPVASNQTDSGRAQNRRIEVSVRSEGRLQGAI